jgi:16S rRNA (adenine1518-N6/adenine1519-N6)-dimethyltransferase
VKHIARKRFGQHFLVDDGVIDGSSTPSPAARSAAGRDRPGLGALTEAAAGERAALTVIELDRDLAARWRATAA